MADIHDSPLWRELFSERGDFAGDPRSIAFSLCSDGVNPFSRERIAYSMWPITLGVLNLPRSVRNKFSSLMLVGIVPGPHEPKNTNPYLELVVDEILELSSKRLYDAASESLFDLKMKIVLNIMDYPGQGKVFHVGGAGAISGCTHCKLVGQYSKQLTKVVYFGSRMFLPSDDPLRSETYTFPEQKQVHEEPEYKTMDFVRSSIADYEAAPTAAEQGRLFKVTGCRGQYPLLKLPGHNRLTDVPVEPMHTIKDCVEHIIKTVSGSNDSGRTAKVLSDEASRGRSWPPRDTLEGHPKPPSKRKKANDTAVLPYQLLTEEIATAGKRVCSIRVPSGFGWKPFGNMFLKTTGMKSHDYKQVATHGILKFALRGLLEKRQRHSINQFCDALAMLLAEDISTEELEAAEVTLHRSLAYLERDFPAAMQNMVFHLLHHVPGDMKRFGPAYGYWMYPFERFLHWVKARALLNRRYPEQTVLQAYVLFDAANYLVSSGAVHDSWLEDDAMLVTSSEALLRVMDAGDVDEDREDEEIQGFPDCEVDAHVKLRGILRQEAITSQPQWFELILQWYAANYPAVARMQECAYLEHRSFADWFLSLPDNSPDKIVMSDKLCLSTTAMAQIRQREIVFTSAHGERDKTHICSSYVRLEDTNKASLGRIVVFVGHSCLSNHHNFAVVQNLGQPDVDGDGCKFVDVRAGCSSFELVPVTNLRRPLVTAVESERPSRVWVLDF